MPTLLVGVVLTVYMLANSSVAFWPIALVIVFLLITVFFC
ncbi:hypothetical protein Rvan_2779 [Rhodomicrobium vannielii ATCC 17100]|uniref:Uncharacterized protein n=1 Tax=Rhodomicrobium vannielii (strain ATCC 17100 / DSM 162 / LMG 4299 / NCIMB 10020 / ATH 3.1.1) TaxID=648757 RepID=E3I863_RHOVT|nr:hypothetical protein Rvan_2779 [Rhodomicrobium vannielii ATCC 17100]